MPSYVAETSEGLTQEANAERKKAEQERAEAERLGDEMDVEKSER